MKYYTAFLKKELLEYMRTYKLLIMLIVVFFVFGLISPLTAKLLPDILASFMPEGITITLTEPAAIDSWTQFFKNTGQMGLFVLVIVFSGLLSAEISKGTLVIMLTKGLPRRTVILAKFTGMSLVWTASFAMSAAVTFIYTVMLFPSDGIQNLLFSLYCLWLFGMFLLSALLLSATLVTNHFGCLLITGGITVLSMLLNIIPSMQEYNPVSLASNNVALLIGAANVSWLNHSAVVCAILSLVFITASVLIFNKRHL